MISIKIVGGLGNQLFQIFAIMAYGIQHNIKVIFPYEDIVLGRHTYWNTFLKNIAIFTTNYPGNHITNNELFNMQIFQEQWFEYKPFPNFENSDICCIGYFQSYKYFENEKDKIYSLIKLNELKDTIVQENKQLFSDTMDTTDTILTISMHFRLGDYKTKRYYHPILNYGYYEVALDHIIETIGANNKKIRVLYFCENEDNIFVYEKRIQPLNNKYPDIEFIKVDDTIDDWKQLLIMASCNHHIIANSTYSWWGAYLNNSDSKIVCYPSKWFGEYYEHTYKCDDLMPLEWKSIFATSTPYDQELV